MLFNLLLMQKPKTFFTNIWNKNIIFVYYAKLMDFAISINEIHIRLTDERWQHISTGHPEMADFYFEILETIENPNVLYKGNSGEIIAVGQKNKISGKFFVVVYKEMERLDGFIITSFMSKKENLFIKKEVVWKRSV